ncbi:MAG: HEAT repeat domain-containing protein [Planctomycetes bacterium]|nr:HEAT repeat domain-containing protein [Planctomycetota bacterium]
MNWSATFWTLLCLVGSATAGESRQDQIEWARDWDDAVKLAQKSSRPIMVHFNMDDEPACAAIAHGHLRDPRIVALSKKFVCVVGSVGDHGDEALFPGDGGHCRRFGTLSCREHGSTESDARLELLETSTVTAPQFIFVNAKLEILARRVWDLSVGELEEIMQRALVYDDPSLTSTDVEQRRKQLVDDLLERASSDHAGRRQEAMSTLASRDDPEIIRFLVQQTGKDVDEVKRNEAIQAIGAARNANCLPTLLDLLTDRSVQIRGNAIVALYHLGMAEAAGPLQKVFGYESSARNQALLVRACLACAPQEEESRKFLLKAMRSSKEPVRAAAAFAASLLSPTSADFKALNGLIRDQDADVRGVAIYAAISLVLRSRNGSGDAASGNTEVVTKALKPLRSTLKKVARSDRDRTLRDFAARGLALLDGGTPATTDDDSADQGLETTLDQFFPDRCAFDSQD